MKRRQFIKGAVAAAVAASFPGGDGVVLYSATHPMRECSFCHGLNGDHFTWCNDVNPLKYTHKTYALATEGMDGQRMANALAKSMMQTMEITSANVFDRAFGG
jgi:hypothetical protein